MIAWFLKYGIWSFLFLILAFWSGTQSSPFFSFFGFMIFFVVAITLGIEGWKKMKSKGEEEGISDDLKK